MSRPRDIALYPARYLDIAGKFQAGARRFEVIERNANAAASLRLDLYSFRKALEANDMRREYSQFFAVRMFVRGRKLVLVHADEPRPV